MTTLFIISTAFAVIFLALVVALVWLANKYADDLETAKKSANYYEKKMNEITKSLTAQNGLFLLKITTDCIYVVKIVKSETIVIRTYKDFEDVEDYKFKLREAEELLDKLNEKY